jgi:uncharacterized integral membrane protein
LHTRAVPASTVIVQSFHPYPGDTPMKNLILLLIILGSLIIGLVIGARIRNKRKELTDRENG